MAEKSEDAGLIAVLIERFESERLPRALELKEKVDKGEKIFPSCYLLLKC